jgi:hypothetical protein
MQAPKPTSTPLPRRGLLAGAGAVGALATAAAVLPTEQTSAPSEKTADAGAATAQQGYRLTEHVKAYYSSTRI